MIAILVMFLGAFASGAAGLYFFMEGESADAQMIGALLGVMTAVLLAAMFFTNDVRERLNKLEKKIEASQNPANNQPQPASKEGVGKRPYRIKGIDQKSGLETELVLDAVSREQAITQAFQRGVDAESIEFKD